MLSQEELKKLLFPHDSIREIQDGMVVDVQKALEARKNVVIHAPTGIGKTVSVLAPALSHALQHSLTVFFLTSRHTQHAIAIDTLKKIKEKYHNDFGVVDLIGKRWMCLQDVDSLPSSDFIEYCKKTREENECDYYLNTRKPTRLPTVDAIAHAAEIKTSGPLHVAELIETCKQPRLCPYEMASLLAKEASVIVADYNTIFNKIIRESLFNRADKQLENCIIIVDEGHNLPSRARDLVTARLTSNIIDYAIKEANKHEYFDQLLGLQQLKQAFTHVSRNLNFNTEEKSISKHEFIDLIEEHRDYAEFVKQLQLTGEDIRTKQKQSFVGSVGAFLDAWQGSDQGYARILSKKDNNIVLNYRCLDPSLVTKDIIDRSYATLIMSGTLNPTEMYADILGFDRYAREHAYPNPYPPENRLALIVPETTTKYNRRSQAEYKKIAETCNNIVANVPGNCALFFPSYEVRDNVYKHLYGICKKNMLIEKQIHTKKEKDALLNQFKQNAAKGAVLLGISTGSFGEGVDLPGDLLKCVVIVGLPLEKPDLETKELIEYYQDMYGHGFDYGYIFPAITKCLQNAGRCIRSETDKGVVVFLDERFAWDNYKRCLPKDLEPKISLNYEERIGDFFKNHQE